MPHFKNKGFFFLFVALSVVISFFNTHATNSLSKSLLHISVSFVDPLSVGDYRGQ